MTIMRLKRPPAAASPNEAPKVPKLFIATPAYGCMATLPYIAGLRALTQSLQSSNIPHILELMGNESLITRARNKVVASFLATDCTHLMFIDADIGFRPEHVARLVGSGYDVCAGAYPMKAIGWGNVHAAVGEGAEPDELAKHAAIYAANPKVDDAMTGRIEVLERMTPAGKTRFVEVDDLATGFMCIARSALERFVEHYRKDIEYLTDYEPVGETHWNVFHADRDPRALAEGKPARYLSEDYWFCRRWQEMGGKCFLCLDIALSHTGTFRFEGDITTIIEDAGAEGGEAA